MRLTLGIVAKCLFDMDVAERAEAVGAAVTDALEAIQRELQGLLFMLPPSLPTPNNRRLASARQRLDQIIYAAINERRSSAEERGDLLSLLMSVRDEDDGSGMTDEQVRDEAITLFFAGHETTALALTWAWELLSRNPEADQRLAEEVSSVARDGRSPRRSSRGSRTPKWSCRRRCAFTYRCPRWGGRRSPTAP